MKKNSTKRALVASILSMVLCCSMLLGTTFAWFTDSVTSTGNVITTGKLDVAMYWVEADEDPATTTAWADASNGPIFKNDKWEPGYLEAKHLKIANEGTLALKYQMRILANGVVSILADVIDVYYFDEAVQMDRADFTDANRLGTLKEVLNVEYANNISKKVAGSLKEGESKTVTLAFKMQESAGNEYQELSLGSDFSIQILATQFTSEKDSFDNQYDADADFPPQEVPAAMVYALSPAKLANITIAGTNGATLDTGYSFQPTETFEQASEGDYEWAHADFYVYADATVPANSMALAGYYTAFDGFNWQGETCTANNWIGLTADVDIAAGESNGVRLLGDGMGLLGVAYSEICNYGNDGIGFLCGATDLTGANEGTTLTVELRVYEAECDDPGCHHNNSCETGDYIVIGKFTYTFGGYYTTLDDGAEVFMADDGDIVLSSVENVVPNANGEYYVPDGVTALGNYVTSSNSEITEVVLPNTVRELGRAFDSDTTLKKVVLNEGLEQIDSRAFKATTALEEVVIPSTVKTIADDAFQKTHLKTITIPASVEYVGAQAFGASLIETVIFEGNPTIQNKAFRGCAALRNVVFYGDDVTFENTTGQANCWFCNSESSNPNTSDITFHVANNTVADKVRTAMGLDIEKVEIIVDIEVVSNDAELANAVANATDKTATILLANGTYSGNLDLTVAALGQAQCEDLIFKAAGNNVVFAGTVTLGYRDQGVGAAMWNANVTFDGITFDHAAAATHSISVQDVKSLNLINCTIIGDGEYGLTSARGNGTGTSTIVGCTFENAAMQLLGNFATGLVIDDCTFNNSRINVQAGNGVTVQNCEFNATLTDTHVGDSFYMIRSNSTPITVKNCEINVDSAVTGVATNQAKWYLLANRGTANWTVENVEVTLTSAALAQTELRVTACTSTGVINTTNLTVNGVAQ